MTKTDCRRPRYDDRSLAFRRWGMEGGKREMGHSEGKGGPAEGWKERNGGERGGRGSRRSGPE